MEAAVLSDAIRLALVVVLGVSAAQLCIKSAVASRPEAPNSNRASHANDIEASLLEHVGATEEELRTAVSQLPHRTALRILRPLQIALAAALATMSVASAVGRALAGDASADPTTTPALVEAVIALGWASQVAALVKARSALERALEDTGLLRRESSTWTVTAFFFYAVWGAAYDRAHAPWCAVGAIACVVSLALEAAIVADGARADEGDGDGDGGARRREKSWVLLLGAAVAYVWPTSFHLRVRAVMCLVLVACIRVLNIAVPFAYKKVIDSFSAAADADVDRSFGALAYPWVVLYLVCSLFQGGTGGGTVGLLSNLRQFLWIPISQEAYKRLSIDIFAHVLRLDHNFHLHRKTGELLRIMDRGTVSVQTLLGTIMFQIGPAMFDIVAAATFLAVRMQLWIAVIVFVSLGVYMPMTIYVTEYRGKYRRELNKLDNARSARATDALLNYETIKIFGNEPLEATNYKNAISNYQEVDFRLIASMNLLNVMQSLVIFSGVASGLLLCTAGVANGTLGVGDTVLFVSMMAQLYAPLNFFGTYYRMLQSAALDMEGVFKLLDTEATIADRPGAVDFRAEEGRGLDIVFDRVRFKYTDEGAEALKGISFTAAGGKTTSLVGATGSGKSTILRLLVRFYDPTAGNITIDGVPLTSIRLASLRRLISVVPQDTVLLNDTIFYNIKYGNPDASDDEVIEAAKGACLYDAIVNRFPAGFDTLVGERGLRLSGGEKQRVAFARAILRNPPCLVLDEATSALDSITEETMWQTLARKKQDRTVVIVAHRLSTVVDSDTIIVVKDGEIAEQGNHRELLEDPKGLYSMLWTKQSQAGEGGGASVEELMNEEG